MQVYAASIMFGYFVRRVDKRFQLERSLGLLPQNQEEAVARLERLFSQVSPSLPACPALAVPQHTAQPQQSLLEDPSPPHTLLPDPHVT